MSYKQAKEFTDKFYGDDAFTTEIIKANSDVKTNHKPDEKEQLELFVKAGKKAGYDFTPDEFKAASKEYFDTLTGWQAINKILHIAKLAKKVEKSDI